MRATMIKTTFFALVICVSFVACSTVEKTSVMYQRKPNETSGRKAGAAMLLYEQAEKDMDVNENVIVRPPVKKTSATQDN